ncbi:MAG: pyridoxal phosphate-dependent class II aminotransferase [Bacteroidaceae bacterium]|nr:pyridoxal phosphate-dependent class II aminotransferase [Bacteroidaceae bacterium]
MTNGHGDDIYKYQHIKLNFSSNVYNHHNQQPLTDYLATQLNAIANYPEPTPATLERMLAEALGMEPRQVMVTNGATEAIYIISQAYSRSFTTVVVPTFAEYADACRLNGHIVRMAPSLDAVPEGTDLLWLCNPCNPTGQVTDAEQLLHAIKSNKNTLFIIDASYAPFTDKSLITPIEAALYPNVLMLHSMTKEFAVPGLRLGYVTAATSLIDRLRRLQMPWSVNAMAQIAGCWLVDHRENYRLPLDMLLKERERVARALSVTGKVDVYPSDTHILLCHLHYGTTAELKDRLARNHGILIRDASNFEGLDAGHFRIAVQTPRENDILIEACLSCSELEPVQPEVN